MLGIKPKPDCFEIRINRAPPCQINMLYYGKLRIKIIMKVKYIESRNKRSIAIKLKEQHKKKCIIFLYDRNTTQSYRNGKLRNGEAL